jgi:hypothetical protein
MIEVRTINPAEREAWNKYIDQTPQAIAWQAYEWSEVVACHYEYQFLPLAAWEESRIVGILPLYLGQVGNGRGLISVPFAVAGGALGDNDTVRRALTERAIAISQQEGGLPITLKQYKVRMPGDFKTDENYFNRELSLQRDLDALRQHISADNLRRAEQARNLGLEVEYPGSDIAAFHRVLLRHHLAQGIPCVGEEWLRTLIDFGMYSFALGRIHGRVIAATMVKKFKTTVSFPFSCVLPQEPASEVAAYGLYWDLISRFATEGYEIFHSGRVPKNQDTLDFRLGWGGTIYPYYYQYYPNSGDSTEFTTRRGLKRRLVSAGWKRLPLTIAKRLGPRLVRRFP